ncbi:hypothetical protein TWF481_006079 [Arthrobotrys musiformis]|uniref:Uncharacterized protein n=1 Tax=Arthrobotrys musiformis TaxID=47236 RepID=A0AAV9WHN3_9PEZI
MENTTENTRKRSGSIYRRSDARDGLIELELAPLSAPPRAYPIFFEYAGRFPKRFRIDELSIPHQITIDGDQGLVNVMRKDYTWLMKLLLKEEKVTLIRRGGEDVSIQIGDDIPSFNIQTAHQTRNLSSINVKMGGKGWMKWCAIAVSLISAICGLAGLGTTHSAVKIIPGVAGIVGVIIAALLHHWGL